MPSGFQGDVAEYYARYRRGYPRAVIDGLVEALGLSNLDTVIDVGCGTGQLTLPLARGVGQVIGVDPEPDTLRLVRAADQDGGQSSVTWILGTSDDLNAIADHDGPVAAITLANAIHLVDRHQLFTDARTALQPGGTLVIIANGTHFGSRTPPGRAHSEASSSTGWRSSWSTSAAQTATPGRCTKKSSPLSITARWPIHLTGVASWDGWSSCRSALPGVDG